MGLKMDLPVPVRMLLAFFMALLCVTTQARAGQKNSDPGPKPDLSIPVEPLGFVAPSSFYLTSRLSSISLDFIDKDHLLFTFRLPGLMKRLPDEPPDDEDQTIRAVVLELPSGHVTAKTDWRMHDRSRYLWRLAEGHFLVRQRSSLFVTDTSLDLKPYINLETALESVQISPDRKMLVVESESKKENRQAVASTVPTLGDPTPQPKPIQIYIMRADTRSVIAHAETLNAVEIPMMGEGHLQAIPGKENKWLIRYMPFHGEARTLTEVQSNCHPSQETISSDVTLVMTCPRSSNDHQVMAVNLDGKTLWQQKWESRYIWPTFQLTQDGSRFAYSSLQVNHSVGIMDPIDETNIVNQMIGVFDTQTGQLRLVKNATPILSAGQNYALSPDGLRFAILRQGAIEVYDLPPVSVSH
ncbi:hypothetical protein H7849_04610 [Alloacidobacterium dinghuense]|uniref:Secreted protein n=1 Tax=Alloacidobacterium dinghuense TaxID=2763107 RepID=A0A7G8BL31_9BACT|nr:hypothetical protein [Alloacidobacterium dinghuense]QNI33251.1 hypothetical protein H7849_04610 [Alloacidobacterium dinghuense]